jgi:hypothetical protein
MDELEEYAELVKGFGLIGRLAIGLGLLRNSSDHDWCGHSMAWRWSRRKKKRRIGARLDASKSSMLISTR